jgi:hypothetical protein
MLPQPNKSECPAFVASGPVWKRGDALPDQQSNPGGKVPRFAGGRDNLLADPPARAPALGVGQRRPVVGGVNAGGMMASCEKKGLSCDP